MFYCGQQTVCEDFLFLQAPKALSYNLNSLFLYLIFYPIMDEICVSIDSGIHYVYLFFFLGGGGRCLDFQFQIFGS